MNMKRGSGFSFQFKFVNRHHLLLPGPPTDPLTTADENQNKYGVERGLEID